MKKRVFVLIGAGLLIVIVAYVSYFIIKPDPMVCLMNVSADFTPQDHTPSPFGHYYVPGDVVVFDGENYHKILNNKWMLEYQDGSAVHIKPWGEEEPKPGETATVLYESCKGEKLTAQLNALYKKISVGADTLTARDACLRSLLHALFSLNDGGYTPEQPEYHSISAFAMLNRLKSENSTLYDQTMEEIITAAGGADEVYMVDESYIIMNGKYDFKLDSKLGLNAKAQLTKLFKDELKLENKIIYTPANNTIELIITPKNALVISWKLLDLKPYLEN